MGIFSYLKAVLPGKTQQYIRWMNNSTALYSWCGNNIYLSDFVNNAIERIASEISKIDVQSTVQNGDFLSPQNDDITRLFRFKPNPLQTTSDFLSNVEWLRRKNRNAFIYPQYQTVTTATGQQFRKYIAFWPLNPQTVEIGVDDTGQAWEVHFYFSDGTDYYIPYADLIHLRWRRGKNTVIGGGDDNGYADDRDVTKVLESLNKTIDGLPKSIESSLQVKGVYNVKAPSGSVSLGKQLKDFEEHIYESKTGIVATDLAADFVPVKVNAPEIPNEAMKFLKAVLQERYGVSAAILSGDYSGEQHSAFYQTAIEDFIVQFEQAFTACCFSAREQDVGHQVRCYYSRVNYMDATSKNNLATLATNVGNMTLNQVNDMYGLPPFEGGNRRLQSLNFVNVELVDKYQLAQAGATQDPNQNNGGNTSGQAE